MFKSPRELETLNIKQILPNATGLARVSQLYSFEVGNGDIIIDGQGVGGRKWTTVSVNPLANNKLTRIKSKESAQAPLRDFIEPSVSSRYRGDYSAVYFADTEAPMETGQTFSIASITQASTTLTIVLNTPFTGFVGNWVAVSGVVDNRLNYFNLCVASVSTDKLTITSVRFDEAALPSLSVGPYTSQGTVTMIDPFGGSKNAFGLRTSGTGATNNAVLSRYGGGLGYFASNTLGSDQTTTTGSTALVPVITGTTGQYGFRASSRYMLEVTPRHARILDAAVDSNSTFTTRTPFLTDVKPDDAKAYSIVFDVITPISNPIPVAKIVKAGKSASAVATITTDAPHGLVTGNYVQTYGIRDTTNFANLATPAAVTVVNATQFTVTIGSSATATSYGGAVTLCNGSTLQQGLLGQTVQSVARNAVGYVTLISGSSWSGIIVGGTVQLHGCRDNVSGADLGVDGAYRVNTLSTTTLILEPIIDFTGTNVSPSGGVITTTSCGGAVIDRVEYRLHDTGLESYNESIIQIDGQGTSDITKALPTVVLNSIGVNQGSAAAVSTADGSGGWFVRPSTTAIADIASAAITSTTTVSSISNSLGSAFQVTIPVTAIAGTSPTMDVRIEHSFDGGTNWFTLYDFQRIIATGNYNSPLLRSTARHIRYVQTIGGTSPSFTRAITRNIWPMHNVSALYRLIDRSIVLTTLNSVTPSLFCPEANNAQLVINLGAATTPPAIQLEGSEDNSNWYPLGTPLTGVGSSTVEVTIASKSATFIRARVSTAGATVTAGYLSLKAWS